ncbi:MAG TPA: nucleoside hydrolase [Verrucomicrobiae bacterium]|jgi:inosine-uridine nucleoside N-ribohydrolase|nr:nucleoside hydrolase [Verrucomicrobiae bacterium]
MITFRFVQSLLAAALLGASALGAAPVRIIFDTDMGNDVDDALALGLLHALQSRGQCELLAVTITKRDENAGPFVDAVNTFYGRPSIPVGYIGGTAEAGPSNYLAEVAAHFPHQLKRSSDAMPALPLLRKILARQPDGSVVLAQVGYFSNFAALLDTEPDEFSPLNGRELVRRKVRLLAVMAGCFQESADLHHFREFNVTQDIPAAQKLARTWPAPMVWSGYEIGIALPFPAASITQDFNYTPHHPLKEAYYAYRPPPHERPTWDLTAALYAVLPDRGFFDLSEPGTVTVEGDGFTRFTPKAGGRDRFLKLTAEEKIRTREALVELSSQPPAR